VSHAGFLRDHTGGDCEAGVIALVQALKAAGDEAAKQPLIAGVARVHEAIDTLPAEARAILSGGDLQILHFTAEAALAPRQMERARVAYLRDAGFDDTAIHDIVHVVCCFSYMNRLADSLGVEVVGPERLAWAERLYGADATAAHTAWAAPG